MVLPLLILLLVKDCDPADGPPCSASAHTNPTATIYDTAQECCGRLGWIDTGACESASTDNSAGFVALASKKYFADYASGACLQDCEPGPFGCALVPPPVALYNSIDACCSVGQGWVDYKYCTSRSVGNYSDGWIVDYTDERCGESLQGGHVLVSSSVPNHSLAAFSFFQ